jgi:hypothetical protein
LGDDLPDGVTEDDLRRLLDSARLTTEATASDPLGDWPEPDRSIVADGRRPPPPRPLEVFGPWRQWIADTAESTSTPPDYAACALLSVAASLLGNAAWVSPWSGWEEPPVIWMGLVGDPSSGKSAALGPFMKIIRDIEKDMAVDFDATRREWETAKEAAECARDAWESEVKTATKNHIPPPLMPANADAPVEPVRPRLVVSDTTQEALTAILAGQPRGLLMNRDELAGWLASFDRYNAGGSERALWLEGTGGRPFTVDRVKNAGKPIIIPRLCVGALGGIQPDRLSTLLFSGDDDGLASRLLMTWPNPIPPARPRRFADHDAAARALRRLVGLSPATGEGGEERPVVASLSSDGAALFQEWRTANYSAIQAASGRLAGHLGKMPGLVLRMALVLEFLWWSWDASTPPPVSVSERFVAAAAALANDYFAPMAERAYGDAALPEAERSAATVGRWILKSVPSVVNARDLRREVRLPGLREAKKVESALETLVDAGWLRPAPARNGDGAGRRRADYAVNPRVCGARDV